MLELVVELLELGGLDALAGEKKGAGHFAEDEAQGESGSGEEGGAMQGRNKNCGEVRIGYWLRGDNVEGAGDVGVFEGQTKNGDCVVERDPAHPLIAGADFSTYEELKGAHHLRERAALFG